MTITLPSLLRLMQDASMHNVIRLKTSIWDDRMAHSAWVLIRKRIEVKRWPKLNEKIQIATYPSGFERIFAYRDFRVFDQDGIEIVHAASTWTLIDLKTRKLKKLPGFIVDIKPEDSTKCLTRVSALSGGADEIDEPSFEYTMRAFDLDWNNHVNNTVYCKLMLEAVNGRKEMKRLKSFQIDIKSETKAGDKVEIYCQKEDSSVYHHKMLKGKDLVCYGRSEWR